MINQFKRKTHKEIIRACMALFMLSTAVSSADSDHDYAISMVNSGEIVELESLFKWLKENNKGRVIEVELERKKQRLIYEIEAVDKQGVVREFIFDARDGSLLKEEIED